MTPPFFPQVASALNIGGEAYQLESPTIMAKGETFPRWMPTNSGGQTALASGTLRCEGIVLPAATLITSITFQAGGTAINGPTAQWFSLWDQNKARLALTSDDGATAWAVNTPKTLNLTTPFLTTYSGLYYLGILTTFTVASVQLAGLIQSTSLATDPFNLAPIAWGGTTASGLTNPASAPASFAFAAAPAGQARMWAGVA